MSESLPLPPEAHSQAGYTINTDLEALDVAMIHWYLSEKSYWASGISRAQVERSIQHSFCFGVYSIEKGLPLQVGFARVITDYATLANLADLFILPDYQGKGLGKWLVATILNHSELQLVRRWSLYTTDAQGL